MKSVSKVIDCGLNDKTLVTGRGREVFFPPVSTQTPIQLIQIFFVSHETGYATCLHRYVTILSVTKIAFS